MNAQVLIGAALTNALFAHAEPAIVPFRVSSALVANIVRADDGRMLLGGGFRSINDHSSQGVARLNVDGTLDTTFRSPLTWGTDVIEAFNGDVIVQGASGRQTFYRLHPDGAFTDFLFPYTPFSTTPAGPLGQINFIGGSGDGRVFVSGELTGFREPDYTWTRQRYVGFNRHGQPLLSFSSAREFATVTDNFLAHSDGSFWALTDLGSTAPSQIFRALPTGAIDRTFQPIFLEPFPRPRIVEQLDGKVLLMGISFTIGGVVKRGMARVHADGSLDETFTPPTAPPTTINAAESWPDGTLWVGGMFQTFYGEPYARLVCLNNDGTINRERSNFSIPNGVIYSLGTLPDGSLVIGGGFSQLNGTLTTNLAVARVSAPSTAAIYMRDYARVFEEGDPVARVSVRRTAPDTARASVDYTISGAAEVLARLTVPLAGTVVFPAGSPTAQYIDIPLPEMDAVWHRDVEFTVTLSDAEGATLLANRSKTEVTVEDAASGLDGAVYSIDAGCNCPGRREGAFPTREVDFMWDGSPPGRGLPADFAVVWRGAIVPELSGDYTFHLVADDSARVSVGGDWIVTQTGAGSGSSGVVSLNAGESYPVEVVFQDAAGGAAVQLAWSSSLIARETVPGRVLRKPAAEASAARLRVAAESGVVHLRAEGVPGSAHILQESSDLANWMGETMLFLDASGTATVPITFTDSTQRFFRVVTP